MLQIFKLKSQDTNQFGYSVAPDKDIQFIAEFKDFEEIEQKYGNREYWAGLELVNKEVVFNQERYDNHVKSSLPLAMGDDLVKFVNKTTETTLDDDQAFAIVSKLKDFLLYCQQGRCNPFSRKTFANTLKTLDEAFQNGQKELIVGLVNQWAETVRFADEK